MPKTTPREEAAVSSLLEKLALAATQTLLGAEILMSVSAEAGSSTDLFELILQKPTAEIDPSELERMQSSYYDKLISTSTHLCIMFLTEEELDHLFDARGTKAQLKHRAPQRAAVREVLRHSLQPLATTVIDTLHENVITGLDDDEMIQHRDMLYPAMVGYMEDVFGRLTDALSVLPRPEPTPGVEA